MTIERFISVMAVLVVGLFLVNAALPAITLAKTNASTSQTCVQCYEPVNTWCVPATAGAATTEKVCAPRAASTPVYDLEKAIGSIVEFPFVVGQCLLGGCP
jgi:hypothetical protein